MSGRFLECEFEGFNPYHISALSKETVQKLKDLGKKGETYDDIVNALLDSRGEAS